MGMYKVVVFDCETDSLPTKEFGFRYTECTCACALAFEMSTIGASDNTQTLLDSGVSITCWRDVIEPGRRGPFDQLFDAFDAAHLVVGFNCLSFDFPVLKKYYNCRDGAATRYWSHRIKTLDVFCRLRDVLDTWPKLSDLLRENGLGSKLTTGDNAIVMWEAQRRVELEDYCRVDVRKTAELALLPVVSFKHLLIPASVYGIEGERLKSSRG